MELLYIAYQPDKVIKKDRKESLPPPLHYKNTKTHVIHVHCMWLFITKGGYICKAETSYYSGPALFFLLASCKKLMLDTAAAYGEGCLVPCACAGQRTYMYMYMYICSTHTNHTHIHIHVYTAIPSRSHAFFRVNLHIYLGPPLAKRGSAGPAIVYTILHCRSFMEWTVTSSSSSGWHNSPLNIC